LPSKRTAVSRRFVGKLDHSIQLALLAAIVESSDDAIVSKTLEGRVLSWNGGAARLFGYTADEMIGKPITTIIPAERLEEERQILEKLKRGERIDHFETIRVTKDGRRLEISLTISPVRDANGVIVGASKIARDIGAERLAERSRAHLAAIVASSVDAIVSKTLDGRIQSWNAGATRIFGYTAEEAIGKSITLIIPPELHAEEREIIARIRNGERLEHFDTIRMTKDGRRIPVSLTVSPVLDLHGVVIGASKVARDISERCKLEQELREREEALREGDRRKNEFLALLAHELRNPLAPIRYALATTKKSARTDEQQRRAEEVIERQVAHMGHLLDDLLDVSRITHGTLELKKSSIELASVLEAAIEAATPMLDAKQHSISLDLPQRAVWLEGDPVRLAQVFSNLLINAAKYTDAGGQIRLRAEQKGNQVIVAVRDNGIGIGADMLPRLFTLFFQAHSALARSEGGLGVGLSLVRGIVALHGGRVEARSEGANRGSEFIVELPTGTPAPVLAETGPMADDPKPRAGLKILVVDDNRDAADTCATLLELSGYQVQTAYDGQAALELAELFRPHALLLDIGLPDFSGYELAQKVRAAPWGSDTLLIALTGWGQGEDKRRALEAGFAHHLTKPVAPETVESLLRTWSAEGIRQRPH
jgi:PAS domain S-box-containing protein